MASQTIDNSVKKRAASPTSNNETTHQKRKKTNVVDNADRSKSIKTWLHEVLDAHTPHFPSGDETIQPTSPYTAHYVGSSISATTSSQESEVSEEPLWLHMIERAFILEPLNKKLEDVLPPRDHEVSLQELKAKRVEFCTVAQGTINKYNFKEKLDSWLDVKEVLNETCELFGFRTKSEQQELNFQSNLQHCRQPYANGAMSRYTILMEILEVDLLPSMFVFSCRQRWKSRGALPPVIPDEGFKPSSPMPSGPRPDTAVFFNTWTIMSQGMPFPSDLDRYLWPLGWGNRCLPFLTIECQKNSKTLDWARIKNFHATNQALYNIHILMKEAGKLDAFFNKIRVFSIAMNAETFEVRVHRGILSDEETSLKYAYWDVGVLKGLYKLQDAVRLKFKIFNYARTALQPVLTDTVRTIIERYLAFHAHDRKSEPDNESDNESDSQSEGW